MDMTLTVVAAPEHLSARLGSDSVVLGVAKGVYFGLDEVAARIWDLLQTPVRAADIRDAIVSEYEVDAPTCERDLVVFLTDLEAQGMIDVVDGRVP
jgi:hypothetical protein